MNEDWYIYVPSILSRERVSSFKKKKKDLEVREGWAKDDFCQVIKVRFTIGWRNLYHRRRHLALILRSHHYHLHHHPPNALFQAALAKTGVRAGLKTKKPKENSRMGK